ncbi:dehydrogenase/reductase SDR family member 12-like [Oratosquilla oratoria]|uniref:dehydrogenase/reductase SDR family member 12-like n=1 Tax=Oratosquilla oratoria TaxID=337810 RepID=UPI003F763DF5
MSLYRNTVWFIKGLKEYTRGGYEAASKQFNSGDLDVDCKGHSYMITGANSGIGKCIAQEIAKRGGKIHMVCRNPKTAEEVRNELIEATGNQELHLHLLDMSSPQDVKNFAKKFVDDDEQLDVLINNAGCMINTREVTSDGLEKNFTTNTLAMYMLTTHLLPILKKSSQPRVVTVSSGGMLVQKLNTDDLQFEKMRPFDGTMVYAQNKRQQVVMTEEFAKKHSDIHFSSMHPGWADTPAVRSSMPDFYEKMKEKLRSPNQGADTAVWLAVAPAALSHPSGLFFQDRKPTAKHLPLAWTKSNTSEDEHLMTLLNDLDSKYS